MIVYSDSQLNPDIFQLGTQVDPNLVGDSHPMLQIVVTMDAILIAKIHRISGPCCTVSQGSDASKGGAIARGKSSGCWEMLGITWISWKIGKENDQLISEK